MHLVDNIVLAMLRKRPSRKCHTIQKILGSSAQLMLALLLDNQSEHSRVHGMVKLLVKSQYGV